MPFSPLQLSSRTLSGVHLRMAHAHTAVKPVVETVVTAAGTGTGTVVARLGLDFVVSRLRYGVGYVGLVAK